MLSGRCRQGCGAYLYPGRRDARVTLTVSPNLADRAGASPALPADGPVTLVDLQRVWIRHQGLSPFRLEYDGRRPMLIFLFSPARPARGGPAVPRGAFSLLLPGRPRSLECAEPAETLAVAFDAPNDCSRIDPSDDTSAKRVDPGVRALAHEMRRVLLSEGAHARDYLTRLADALLARALQVSGPERRRRRRPDLAPFNLRRVEEHIDSRLAERINVSELASVAGLSRGYFSSAFRAATGESPHQFILTRRLAEARRRLDAGAGDLAQLALQTGFSSHAHLTTAFGRAFGVTPHAYRRLWRNADPTPALAPPSSAAA
jgi:AraC family transcriptional regulator